ncbi:MAG: 4-hydroxythreonine-4-phosphate dehydrogenase PdxA [Defluviitaleaceae bacterium]|nr:4-hydroxythreonine-4-phosphate dehydrogenase PdxA [Defluviitaleaceae bacterium]
MGDPAGIGPEISVMALASSAVYDICRPVVIGEADIMREALRVTGRGGIAVRAIANVSEAEFAYGTIDVLHIGAISLADISPGEISAKTGDAAFRYVEKVIRLAQNGDICATVTNALSKEALNLAGHNYAGHTEIYADLTNTTKYSMLLAHEDIRVVHVSTHVSLRRACDMVTRERVQEVITLADRACKSLGIALPKIAVAGLNPHSGESGMFGTEEIDEIIPAIEYARSQGINAEGPIPPDTVFPKARGGWYDIVVAMYHDQGHIPLKMEGFVYDKHKQAWAAVSGVNITLGLPIIRTSVDHGTAMDQAYKGTASALSLENAIEYAVRFANNRGTQ